VDWILNPEHRNVENQIPHGAATYASDDRKPHERHHVQTFARGDQRTGHGEHDRRNDIEDMDETEEVRGIDRYGLHAMTSGPVKRWTKSDRIR
jgi:hypothetical protein